MKLYEFVQVQFAKDYDVKYKATHEMSNICNELEVLYYENMGTDLHISLQNRKGITTILKYFAVWSSLKSMAGCEIIYASGYKGLSDQFTREVEELCPKNFLRIRGTSVGGTVCGSGAGKLRKEWGGCILLDAFEGDLTKSVAWIQNTLYTRKHNLDRTPMIVIEYGNLLVPYLKELNPYLRQIS